MIENPVSPVFVPFHDTSFIKFISRFKTEEDCLEYLYNLKFSNGFTCSKCNNTTSYKGVKPFTQVCRSCRHTESATSNTLFHKVKFGLKNAFMIIYDMTATTKGMSARAIGVKYDIKKDSAWLFMKKVRTSMASSTNHPMIGKVYVDEFVLGGYEKGAVGRKTNSKKVKAVMAVETTNTNQIKRAYTIIIDNYSADSLRQLFEKHISKDAFVYTDEWTGYSPLKSNWNIKQDKKYKNNSPVNRMIQQTKSWIRGIYHSVSDYHCKDYFNEFSFRLNRSQWRDSAFHKCVERMVNSEKKSRLQLSRVQCKSHDEFSGRIYLLERMGVKYDVRYGKIKLLGMKKEMVA
jgi:transposase-like protein